LAKDNKIQKYAIVDLETTGGMPKRDRIIEVAIVIYEGNQITEKYSSLVNPERSISYEITRITGIHDGMVEDAPKFYEIAKQIVLMTEGAIFVAHNVNFDYNFLREEFDRLGYTYSRKNLCTVKLSRKAFPGLKSYSLGNLIRHFDIEVAARHRALDDAYATAIIFDKIIHKEGHEMTKVLIDRGVKENKLPEAITLERIHQLPEKAGVYFFYDIYNTIIYVGKSINIKSRIMQHFQQITSKSEKLVRKSADLDYILTGSELIALLLESEKIKILNPEINRAQKTKDYPYFISSAKDEKGYVCFSVHKKTVKALGKEVVLSYHSSIAGAKSKLAHTRELFTLCEEKIHVTGDTNRKCFFYSMQECYGACRGEETIAEYNVRANEAYDYLIKTFEENFIIVTEGRSPSEKGLVLIEDGQYRGYGYIDENEVKYGIEELKEAIEIRYSTPESNQIIIQYLSEHPRTKLIRF
jgi:DNA polymerase III subunit epsilon